MLWGAGALHSGRGGMKAKWLVIVAACALFGCGAEAAGNAQARDDMMQSKQAYAYCLRANGSAPQTCVSLEQAYEADVRAYKATSTGVRPVDAAWSDKSSN